MFETVKTQIQNLKQLADMATDSKIKLDRVQVEFKKSKAILLDINKQIKAYQHEITPRLNKITTILDNIKKHQ